MPETVGLIHARTAHVHNFVLDRLSKFHSTPAVQAYVWERVMPLLPQWLQQVAEQEPIPYENPAAVHLYTVYLSRHSNSSELFDFTYAVVPVAVLDLF